MALDYVSLSSNMASAYNTLKLSPTVNPGNSWVQSFQTNYDNDAQNGTFPSGVKIVSDTASLSFAVSNSTTTIDNLVTALITYWGGQKTKGTPSAKSNTITTITNDASTVLLPLKVSLAGISTEKTPPYEWFFSTIETEVKKIKWTVTESVPGANSITYDVQIT